MSALVYSLVREGVPEPLRRARFLENDVARFVLARMERMPAHLRLPVQVLTWAFDQEARLGGLRPFRRLPPEARARAVARWRRSRLGARRQLVRFYESLVLYAWHALRAEEDGDLP